MKDLFHIVDEAQVILKSGGVFYQRKVYRRGRRLYAEHGGGFIRLGLHDASESVCSEDGLIILELVGDKAKQQELFNALKKVPCLNVKLETLAIDNCPK